MVSSVKGNIALPYTVYSASRSNRQEHDNEIIKIIYFLSCSCNLVLDALYTVYGSTVLPEPRRPHDMEHHYKGWIIERSEDGHFNLRPANEDFWLDGAELLREAKIKIDRWTDS